MRLSLSAAPMRRRCSFPPISAACCLKAALMMPCATSSFLAGSGGSTSAICIAVMLLSSVYKHRYVPRLSVAMGPGMTLHRSPSAFCVQDENTALHGLEPKACTRPAFSPVRVADTVRPQPFPPLPHAPILPLLTRAHPVLPFKRKMWMSLHSHADCALQAGERQRTVPLRRCVGDCCCLLYVDTQSATVHQVASVGNDIEAVPPTSMRAWHGVR